MNTTPTIELSGSRLLTAWMAEQQVSLTFSTYQIGKLFFIGLNPDGQLSVFQRTFNRCMGLYSTGQSLYLSTLYQLWRFENFLEPGQQHQGYDRLYVPLTGYTTGDIDVHDLAVDRAGQVVFVNTLFSCLATVSERHSFKPLWQPPFISRLAAEDRCHLNGLALRDGALAYVTCIGRSDANEGWREHRQQGGLVLDVTNGETVCAGLSMPHSPRWYQGRLWLLNSGTGEFGYVDFARGTFEPIAFCPGYLRGLAFVGDYAVVGLSRPRHNKAFTGLALDGRLAAKGVSARCAVQIIDLKKGDVVHELRIEGMVEELYDVATLPGVRRPMALGFQTDEIRRIIRVSETA